jgi:hypothetical protein
MELSNQIAFMMDVVTMDIFTTTFLSINWVLPSLSSIALKCNLFYSLTKTYKDYEYNGLIIYPLSVCMVM